jgi:hypothetical protein
MNQDEYNALAARHGGEAGKSVTNPTVKDADPNSPTYNQDIPNPNPIYRYVFKDGTYVEARDSKTTRTASDPLDLVVTNPGTALKQDDTNKPSDVSAPATQQYIVTRLPDGTLKADKNPNYKGDGKDPSSATVTFGDQLIGVSDDGKGNLTTKVLLTKDPAAVSKQAVTLPDGSLGSFDPKSGTVETIVAAGAKNPGTPVKGGDGKFYVWSPTANGGAGGMVDSGMPAGAASVVGTGADDEFIYALDGQGNEIEGSRRPNPNYKKPGQTLVGTDVNSEFTYAVDKDGNEVPGSRRKNPNYTAPTPTELNPDTISAVRGLLQPDGTIKWVKNEQQLTVSQAMADLMNQAGMKVTAGSMSMDDAKNMLTGAVNLMNAQTARQTADTATQRLGLDAANNTITGVNQAAATGAGLLQNRVTAATGALNNVVGQLGGGNLLGKLPSGWGANLAGGLQEWVTGLGGGQPVYDSAAAMVNQANPAISGNPTVAQQAYQALRGYMDLYKAKTGQDWQPGQATPGGVGGAGTQFQAPTTVPGTAQGQQTNTGVDQALATQQQSAAQQAGNVGTPSTATLNAQGLMDNAQGRAMAANQVPIAAGGAPQYPGQINLAYQQGVVSPVGRPANLAASPMLSTQPTPMPMIPGVYSPYGPFMAPQTV